MSWAQRLKRVFDIDVEICAHCGGAVKIIACIEDRAVIDRILEHLRLSASSPGPPAAGPSTPGWISRTAVRITTIFASIGCSLSSPLQ
jgi:hypothetical protein